MSAAPTAPPETRPPGLARGAVLGLVVLTGINLFNYIDRNVISGVEESVKDAFQLRDWQSGALPFGLIIVYSLTAPFFGSSGDRGSRPRLVAAGVALWSVATALAGLAGGFWTLFAARSAVGVGEAAYGTIGPSLLADYFPKSVRGRVFAIFYAAIPIGYALGYMIGGFVGDPHRWGWRAAFYVAGIPGLALAALALALRDPPRGAAEDGDVGHAAHGAGGGLAVYRRLLENRPYVLTVLGYAAYTFALGGLAFWMVPFLERVRHVPKADAATNFGAIIVVTGFVGTLAGGWIGDRLLRVTKEGYLWLSGIATLLGAPPVAIAILSPDPHVFYGACVVAELLLFASTGPINTAIVNQVAPEIRATAVAASIFTIHILGDAISPFLIGGVSDATGSLERAMLIVPVAVVVGGAIWTLGAWLGGRTPERE
jgi:MFS family permease